MRVELSRDGVIEKLQIDGGCDGNLQAIAILAEGLPARTAIQKLKGIRCGFKATSCPDQLALGLERALKEAGLA